MTEETEPPSVPGAVTRRGTLAAGAGALGLAGLGGRGRAADPTDDVDPADTSEGPRRVRGVYVHPRWYWDAETPELSRLSMTHWLELADQANVNVLFAWLESPELAALLGEERYAESSAYGFWGGDGWDPMAALLEGARSRGMEVHLWYSFTRYKRTREWVPEYDPDNATLPPGDPAWASVRKSEYLDGHTDAADPGVSATSLCANATGAHEWTLAVLDAVFEAYPDLAGLHIEEPGYLASDRCVCGRCRAVFADLYDADGAALVDHVHADTEAYATDDAAVPVKTRGTDRFVRRLDDWWAAAVGDRVLSFNGSWAPTWDRVRGRNWAQWSREGLVPYYFPQVYTEDTELFVGEAKTTMDAVGDTAVEPIVGVEWSSGSNLATEVKAQVEAAHALDGYADTPVDGAGLFSGAALSPDVVLALRAGPYRTATRPPWREGASAEDSPDMTRSELSRLRPFAENDHWGELLAGSEPGPSV